MRYTNAQRNTPVTAIQRGDYVDVYGAGNHYLYRAEGKLVGTAGTSVTVDKGARFYCFTFDSHGRADVSTYEKSPGDYRNNQNREFKTIHSPKPLTLDEKIRFSRFALLIMVILPLCSWGIIYYYELPWTVPGVLT